MVQLSPPSPAVAAAIAVFLPAQGRALLDRPAGPAPPLADVAPDPRLIAALRAAAPALSPSAAANWAGILAAPMHAAAITTPRRIAGFVGQCAVESDGFTSTAENLRYSHAARICAVWPSRFPSTDAATPYVDAPEALANCVYANRMGNGPPASGDGWRFRGLGLIQITGRGEYTAFAQAIGRTVDDAAAWAATPAGAAASATWFWSWKALNAAADAWDLQTLTKRINGGLIGWPDRQHACNAARAALGEP